VLRRCLELIENINKQNRIAIRHMGICGKILHPRLKRQIAHGVPGLCEECFVAIEADGGARKACL